MSVDESPGAREVPLRAARDAHRRSLTTAEAAGRIGRSRFYVADMVQRGELEGYGVPSEHRTRWYVYEDTLPVPSTQSEIGGVYEPGDLVRLVEELATAVREERLARLSASKGANRSLQTMRTAFVALRDGDDEDGLTRFHDANEEASEASLQELEAQMLSEKVSDCLRQLLALGLDGTTPSTAESGRGATAEARR